MSRKTKKLVGIREHSRFVAYVSIGTLARVSDRYLGSLVQNYGVNLDAVNNVRTIHFDAQEDAAASQVPLLDGDFGAAPTPGSTFIEGQNPDSESLQKLEKQGRLYFTSLDWATKNGQAKQDAGTGGNGRTARALFEAARPRIEKALSDAFRDFRDYERQRAKAVISKPDPDGEVCLVVLTYSTPGGFGPGTRHAMTRLIEKLAGQLGVHVKLICIGMCLGSVEPVNPDQGVLNEVGLLHYTQADLVADLDYVSGDAHRSRQAPESTVLVTNQNAYGEIPTLARLQAMVGHLKFHLAFTSLGRLLTERIVDIEKASECDEQGGPRCISTTGLSLLNVDVEKLLGFAGCEAMSALCERLLTPPDIKAIRQNVLATARHLGLVEQPDEALASTRVARSEAFAGVDVYERLGSVFASRLEGFSGFRLCQELPRAFNFCITRELPRNLAPILRGTATSVAQTAVERIKEEVALSLKKPDALRRAQAYLISFQAAVQHFSRSNAETTRVVGESLKPLAETMSNVLDQIEELAQERWFVRWLKPFTIARLAREYRFAAEAVLRGNAEIELRNVLAQELYRPLLAAITQELERVNNVVACVESLLERARTGKEDYSNVPAERRVPVGLELATPEFLERRTTGLIAGLGGAEKLTDGLFHATMGQFGSLDGLLERDLDQTEDILTPICEMPFEDAVRAMDVLTVFHEEFPDPAKQKQIIEQLIREASGRLIVTGEAGRRVPWIKIAGLGSTEGAEGFIKLLRDADDEPSLWLPCEHGDQVSVVLLMYRSSISLDGLLRQIHRRHGIDHRDLTPESGPDPITYILPSVRPDDKELSRTIVRAMALGALKEERGLFTFVDSTTGDVSTGHNPVEARNALAKAYPMRVQATVRFTEAVVANRVGVLGQLRLLREKVRDGNGDGLSLLIDERAIAAVEQEVELLWPYLKRVPNGRDMA